MPSRPVGVTDTATATGVAEVATHERGDPGVSTTTTADPGSGGTSLAVTLRDRFPQSGSFKVLVEKEVMLVTAGHGTGAGSFTVTRGQDGTTAVAHTSGVTVQQIVAVQLVEPVSPRSISYLGKCISFRTLGNAAASQNLFTIENASASTMLIGIRKLVVEMATTAVLTTQPVQFQTSRPASLPTGGTTLTKTPMDTALTSSASVVCRGATASHGGAATAITATAGTTSWHKFGSHLYTAVGQVLPDDFDVLPAEPANEDTEILRAGQSILVQVIHATAASNAATNHYVVKVAWEEFNVA